MRPQPAQAPPRCTKCNSQPINGQCTKLPITALLYKGPLPCGFNMPIKGLICSTAAHKLTVKTNTAKCQLKSCKLTSCRAPACHRLYVLHNSHVVNGAPGEVAISMKNITRDCAVHWTNANVVYTDTIRTAHVTAGICLPQTEMETQVATYWSIYTSQCVHNKNKANYILE